MRRFSNFRKGLDHLPKATSRDIKGLRSFYWGSFLKLPTFEGHDHCFSEATERGYPRGASVRVIDFSSFILKLGFSMFVFSLTMHSYLLTVKYIQTYNIGIKNKVRENKPILLHGFGAVT